MKTIKTIWVLIKVIIIKIILVAPKLISLTIHIIDRIILDIIEVIEEETIGVKNGKTRGEEQGNY